MANPNIVNVSSIYGRTIGYVATTTEAAAVTNSSGSNKIFKINTIIVSNYHGTTAYDINVRVYDSSAAAFYYLASTVSVPADATLVVISKDTSIYLEEGDYLSFWASSNNVLQYVISYEEIA
jgi:hypothetical protein